MDQILVVSTWFLVNSTHHSHVWYRLLGRLGLDGRLHEGISAQSSASLGDNFEAIPSCGDLKDYVLGISSCISHLARERR